MLLHELLQDKQVILASNSPRRKQFLQDLGISFVVKPSDADESYPDTLEKSEITDFIAQAKAAVFTDLAPNELLITSDTLVWNEKEVLGKPADREEAFRVIRGLSDKTHHVISSVCLTTTEKKHTFHCTTEVTFTDLSDEEIWYYIDKFAPFDKAGAYGIQEWIGLIAIKEIKGSYTNVVGLPTEKLYHELIKFLS